MLFFQKDFIFLQKRACHISFLYCYFTDLQFTEGNASQAVHQDYAQSSYTLFISHQLEMPIFSFKDTLLYEIFANFHVLLNHSFYTKDAAPQWFDHAQNPKFWCVVFMFRYIQRSLLECNLCTYWPAAMQIDNIQHKVLQISDAVYSGSFAANCT